MLEPTGAGPPVPGTPKKLAGGKFSPNKLLGGPATPKKPARDKYSSNKLLGGPGIPRKLAGDKCSLSKLLRASTGQSYRHFPDNGKMRLEKTSVFSG